MLFQGMIKNIESRCKILDVKIFIAKNKWLYKIVMNVLYNIVCVVLQK